MDAVPVADVRRGLARPARSARRACLALQRPGRLLLGQCQHHMHCCCWRRWRRANDVQPVIPVAEQIAKRTGLPVLDAAASRRRLRRLRLLVSDLQSPRRALVHTGAQLTTPMCPAQFRSTCCFLCLGCRDCTPAVAASTLGCTTTTIGCALSSTPRATRLTGRHTPTNT